MISGDALRYKEIRLPRFFQASHVISEKHDVTRSEWLTSKRHLRLLGGTISLSVIARHARCDQILPRILSSSTLRIHMVDR